MEEKEMNRGYLSQAKTVPCRTLGLLFVLTLIYFLPPAASAQVLWSADTSRGTAVFEGLEEAPGIIDVVADPKGVYGNVYKYSTWDDSSYGKERCESRGTRTPSGDFRVSLGGTYYIGWRAFWQPMPTDGSWVGFWQMHSYRPPGEGAPLGSAFSKRRRKSLHAEWRERCERELLAHSPAPRGVERVCGPCPPRKGSDGLGGAVVRRPTANLYQRQDSLLRLDLG